MADDLYRLSDFTAASRARAARTPQYGSPATRRRAQAVARLRAGRPAGTSSSLGPDTARPTGGGGGGHKPLSLAGQFKQAAFGVIPGVGHLAETATQSLLTLPRLAIDAATGRLGEQLDEAGGWKAHDIYNPELMTPELQAYIESTGRPMKEGGFRSFLHEYSPLGSEIGESAIGHTVPRLYHTVRDFNLDEYKQASAEGNIVNTVIEDISNIALAGGVVSKALGATALPTTVGSRATAEVVEGGAIARDLSSAAVAERVPVVRAPRLPEVREIGTVTEAGKVAPLEAPAVVPGRGIAGRLQRAAWEGDPLKGTLTRPGLETAAQVTSRVSRGVGYTARLGEALDNVQMAWPARGIAAIAKKAGVGQLLETGFDRAAVRLAEGEGSLARIAKSLTPEARDYRRQIADVEASLKRETTATERAILQAPRIAQIAGLDNAQSRAALFGIDQRFIPAVEAYRSMLDSGLDVDTVSNVIERSYLDLPDQLRPTVEDVQAYVDWQDGKLDDVQSEAMNRVEQAMRQGSDTLTKQLSVRGMLNPEQLANDYLTEPKQEIVEGIEAGRERKLKERDAVFGKAYRAERVTAAHEALDGLPPTPRLSEARAQGRKVGIAQARAIAERKRLYDAQTAVRRALKAYEQAEGEATDGALIERLGKELDRATERAEAIREQLALSTRRRQAASPLSRIEDRLVSEGEVAARPEPDFSDIGSHASVKRGLGAIAEREAQSAFDALEALTRGERLATPTGARHRTKGEWDWYDTAQVQRRRPVYTREGYLLPMDRGGMPADQLAQIMSSVIGRELSVDEAVGMYFDAVEHIETMKSHSNEVGINEMAERLGLPQEVVEIAATGSAKDFRAAMRDYGVVALDEMQSAFADLEPTVQEAVLDGLRELRESGADDDALGDYVADAVEMSAGGDTRGILDPVWGRVPMGDLVDWLTGKEISQSIYETVLGKRGPVQHRMLAKLDQLIVDLRGELGDANRTRRRAETNMNQAQREADRRARRAGNTLDNAANVEQRVARASEIADAKYDALNAELKRANKQRGPWDRGAGETSRAERIVYRRGTLRERANTTAAVVRRLDRSIAKFNERIANLDTELGRDYLERLDTDVNTPAYNSIARKIRAVESGMGDLIVKKDHPPRVTGVLGKIASKYGIEDSLIQALDDEISAATRERRTFTPADKRRALQTALDEAGEVLGDVDEKWIERSFNTDQLLHELNTIRGGRQHGANNLFRVYEHFRQERDARKLPSDTISQVDAAFDYYLKRRHNFLHTVMDNQSAVMPGRWRAVGINSRMLVRGLLDEAEAMYQRGDGQSAIVLTQIAEDVPTTLQQMINAGIDPTHLTGGEPVSISGRGRGGGGIGVRSLRATERLQTGLRPVNLTDVARLEIQEAVGLLYNEASAAIVEKFSVRADEIAADVIAEHGIKHPLDQTVPERELRRALDDAGWTTAPGHEGRILRDTRVIPREVRRQLDASAAPNGMIWETMHAGNRLFKTTVLPFSPKWHIGNVIGNAMQAMVLGRVGPLELARTLDEIARREGGWREFIRNGGLPYWAPDEIATHGLTFNEHDLRWGKGNVLDELTGEEGPGRARQMFRDVVAGSYNINEFVDNATRSAVYLSGLRKGMSPEVALQHSLRAMGDFTRMTPFERRWVREVFPFYTWLRHQTVSAMRLPVYSPTRAAFLMNMSNMMNDPEYGTDMLRILGAKVPLGGDRFLNLGTIAPFATPFDMPLDPTQPNVLSSVSPMIGLTGRALLGVDPAAPGRPASGPPDQRPVDQYGREIPRSPLRQIAGGLLSGNFRQAAHGVGEIGYVAAGELPQTRTLRDLALDVTSGNLGDFRYKSGDKGPEGFARPRSVLQTVAAGLGVPWTETVDIDKLMREQRERERENRRRN